MLYQLNYYSSSLIITKIRIIISNYMRDTLHMLEIRNDINERSSSDVGKGGGGTNNIND